MVVKYLLCSVDGKPMRETMWACGRMTGKQNRAVFMDRVPAMGERVKIHVGYGNVETYRFDGVKLVKLAMLADICAD